jgi:cytochrome c-type biogenesis protein CcmH/NrfF
LLWFGPPLLLLVALVGVGLGLRRRRVAAPAPLTPEERQRLDSLLAEPGDPGQRRKRR